MKAATMTETGCEIVCENVDSSSDIVWRLFFPPNIFKDNCELPDVTEQIQHLAAGRKVFAARGGSISLGQNQ